MVEACLFDYFLLWACLIVDRVALAKQGNAPHTPNVLGYMMKLMSSIKAFKLQYYIPDCLLLCIALRP